MKNFKDEKAQHISITENIWEKLADSSHINQIKLFENSRRIYTFKKIIFENISINKQKFNFYLTILGDSGI